jgi:hypothetical protein
MEIPGRDIDLAEIPRRDGLPDGRIRGGGRSGFSQINDRPDEGRIKRTNRASTQSWKKANLTHLPSGRLAAFWSPSEIGQVSSMAPKQSSTLRASSSEIAPPV